MDVELDLRKNAVLNAKEHYEKSKKSAEKLKGARKALDDTNRKIQELNDKSSIPKEISVRKREVKERKWFDKFRTFESSDGFFVVGGRDAVTNEILIKKHVEKHDLVFHANVQGAPFFVIKNPENKDVPDGTLREAAEAAASYSSSWKKGLGSCDVYQVAPEQVTKQAESGEYLPKGGFMIRGAKNWFRGVGLKIAVGFAVGEYIEVMGGPVSAIMAKTKHYALIGVGDLKSKELAIEVKKSVLRRAGKEDGARIKDVSLDELQKFLPGGGGMVLS